MFKRKRREVGMFSFFKKKQAPAEENKPFVVKAYLSGKVVPIEEVKDEVFSSKALGDGLAIEPEENVIVAPCDATVSVLMEGSRHAVGLTLANGVEILIHEGIEYYPWYLSMFYQQEKEPERFIYEVDLAGL